MFNPNEVSEFSSSATTARVNPYANRRTVNGLMTAAKAATGANNGVVAVLMHNTDGVWLPVKNLSVPIMESTYTDGVAMLVQDAVWKKAVDGESLSIALHFKVTVFNSASRKFEEVFSTVPTAGSNTESVDLGIDSTGGGYKDWKDEVPSHVAKIQWYVTVGGKSVAVAYKLLNQEPTKLLDLLISAPERFIGSTTLNRDIVEQLTKIRSSAK